MWYRDIKTSATVAMTAEAEMATIATSSSHDVFLYPIVKLTP